MWVYTYLVYFFQSLITWVRNSINFHLYQIEYFKITIIFVWSKGDQSWVFIGRTVAGDETPNTLATSCEELTHWKRPWCWEVLGTGREGDNRGWDGWMASPTRCTWVWMNSGSWWWIGRPGVLRFMGSWRVRHDWATELNRHKRGNWQ